MKKIDFAGRNNGDAFDGRLRDWLQNPLEDTMGRSDWSDQAFFVLLGEATGCYE